MPRLTNKIAIVTGAAAGIGRAIAQRFAAEGATVIATDVDERVLALPGAEPPGEGTDNGIVTGSIEGRLCDISDDAQVRALMAHCAARHGRLDVLVNNAGIGPRERVRLHEVDLADWDRVVGVNQRGAFIMMKHGLPLMFERGGSIVNVASVGAFTATSGAAAYFASKGALLMMTKAAAVEYREQGVRVNAICPGMTRTSIFDAATEEQMKALLARTPARMIEPEEVANLALFLASDESAAISGTSHVIDNARTAGS